MNTHRFAIGFVAAFGVIAAAALLSGAITAQPSSATTYHTVLAPLNGSGVSATAQLTRDGDQVRITIDAMGLVDDQPHSQELTLPSADALPRCPTPAPDTNHDGVISAQEGEAAYGQPMRQLEPFPTADHEHFDHTFTIDSATDLTKTAVAINYNLLVG